MKKNFRRMAIPMLILSLFICVLSSCGNPPDPPYGVWEGTYTHEVNDETISEGTAHIEFSEENSGQRHRGVWTITIDGEATTRNFVWNVDCGHALVEFENGEQIDFPYTQVKGQKDGDELRFTNDIGGAYSGQYKLVRVEE